MTLSASLMIIMIELLRRLTIDKLPKKLFLALWTVTVLRLIIPFSLPFRYSVQSGIFRLITAATGRSFGTLDSGGQFRCFCDEGCFWSDGCGDRGGFVGFIRGSRNCRSRF